MRVGFSQLLTECRGVVRVVGRGRVSSSRASAQAGTPHPHALKTPKSPSLKPSGPSHSGPQPPLHPPTPSPPGLTPKGPRHELNAQRLRRARRTLLQAEGSVLVFSGGGGGEFNSGASSFLFAQGGFRVFWGGCLGPNPTSLRV